MPNGTVDGDKRHQKDQYAKSDSLCHAFETVIYLRLIPGLCHYDPVFVHMGECFEGVIGQVGDRTFGAVSVHIDAVEHLVAFDLGKGQCFSDRSDL